MFKEEIEKAREAAIVIDANILLRSSEHVSSFDYGEILDLPQYYLIHKLHAGPQKGNTYTWVAKRYYAETCAVLEVIYLDAKAPPKLPEIEERPLKDPLAIADAVQRIFPALDLRYPIRFAAKDILYSYGRSEIIHKIDGVFHFDEDFKETRLINYGPQKPDAQT